MWLDGIRPGGAKGCSHGWSDASTPASETRGKDTPPKRPPRRGGGIAFWRVRRFCETDISSAPSGADSQITAHDHGFRWGQVNSTKLGLNVPVGNNSTNCASKARRRRREAPACTRTYSLHLG